MEHLVQRLALQFTGIPVGCCEADLAQVLQQTLPGVHIAELCVAKVQNRAMGFGSCTVSAPKAARLLQALAGVARAGAVQVRSSKSHWLL